MTVMIVRIYKTLRVTQKIYKNMLDSYINSYKGEEMYVFIVLLFIRET